MQEDIEEQAEILGSKLRIGKGKKALLSDMLRRAIGKPCPYCGDTIMLSTASIDHKIPYANNQLREKGTRAEKAMVDDPANLHIVCRSCNALKEDFTHTEYQFLLKFGEVFPDIWAKLKKRLGRSRFIWRRR